MSASLGSTQTVQVRVAAATLQAGPQIPDEADRDGYWTNLNFLNSLRELGNTVSLLESDVPDYLVGLQRRDGITPRWPRNTMELTSRRRSDEIPKAIEQLQETLPCAGLRRHLPGVEHHRGRCRHRPPRPDDDRRPAEDDRAVHPGQRPRRP